MKLPEDLLKDISEKLSKAPLPVDDLKNNLQAFLHSSLARLDLVTREEFNIQARVLERTREKVEAMEAQIKTLEQQIQEITKD